MYLSSYVSVMVYGQFRSFKLNLQNNLNILYDMFKPDTKFLFFILSDKKKSGNYSNTNESLIKTIISSNPNNYIAYFDYIENINNAITKQNKVNSYFYNNLQNVNDTNGNNFMGSLIYNKYLLNKIKNNYLNEFNIQTEYHVFFRLFDINIQKIGNYNFLQHIDDKSIVGSLDTIFIGKKQSIDFLLKLSKLIKLGFVYHKYILDNTEFSKAVSILDYNLYSNKIVYCPEIQYLAHLFFNNYTFYNIRFDYTNQNNVEPLINEVYDIRLCSNRYKYE